VPEYEESSRRSSGNGEFRMAYLRGAFEEHGFSGYICNFLRNPLVEKVKVNVKLSLSFN
jgi:hypothetical protein